MFSFVFSTIFLLSLILPLSGCTAARTLIALSRSTSHFVAYQPDPRILYEPGAEAWAAEVAPLLPAAIEKVEQGQYIPFQESPKVYVCTSQESFYRLTASNARAVVIQKLFLSPVLFKDPPVLPLYLAHELSHLHLQQRLGLFGSVRLPSWFKEGLAALVSGGGGALSVTDAQAQEAIRQGRSFIPDAGRGVLASFLFPRYGRYWNLDQQMFYRQAMLFVGFLRKRDEAAFRRLLLEIQAGTPFAKALSSSYHLDLTDLWSRFLQEVKEQDGG